MGGKLGKEQVRQGEKAEDGLVSVISATSGGSWGAQAVQTTAQVMISRFVGSGPALGSVLTARSLEPASDSVSPSLSAPPLLTLCLWLSQKYMNI